MPMTAVNQSMSAISPLSLSDLSCVSGGRNTVDATFDSAKIEGKGTLVYGTVAVNGYTLPVVQWHPVKN
jgi:hypothetical protein